MAAFDLFGVHDWAPYILNGFILFVLLVVAARAIGLPDSPAKLVIVLSLLMLQIPFQGILQFTPDFALAVFTAGCVVLILKEGCWPSRRFSLRRQFGIGLLGSCALITKPPFSPLTIVLLVSAFGMAELFRFALNRDERALAPILWRTLAFWAGVIILAGPFFFLAWRAVAEYIAMNTGSGQYASQWKVNGGFLGSLAFRIRGWAAYLTFGPLLTPLTIWLGLGLVAQLILQHWRSLLFTSGVLILSAISLLILTVTELTNPNFSFGWEVLFALAAMISVGQLAKLRYGTIIAGCYFAMMVFVFYKAGPPRQIGLFVDDAAKGHSLNQVLLTSISERTISNQQPKQVLLSFIGGVNAASQEWLSRTQKLGIHVEDPPPNPDEVLKKARSADFVEVADPSSSWFPSWVPINRSQALLLDRMRADRNFDEVRSFVGRGGTVYLFQRRAATQ
jgi:hypothetical protein